MCSNNAGWCPCSSENRKWVCSKTTGYWDDWKCWQVLLHMLTQMKGWSQIRSGRRKESTRQWSTRKKILSRDRGNFLSFSSSLPCNSIFLLWKRKKRRYVPFPSKIELSFLPGSSSSETRYDSFPADSGLCHSAARLALKQVYSALLPPPALHKVNQGP